MKLIIDIPEEDFERCKKKFRMRLNIMGDAIAKGTPLPKGHGRLIDADVLVDGMEDDYEFCEAVNATPTVIKGQGW